MRLRRIKQLRLDGGEGGTLRRMFIDVCAIL